ncbi:RNA-directed RNA polymerase, partial [ssRNA phage SRR6960509_16]
MKSLTWLLSCMLTDVSVRCGTDTQRDYIRIVARYKHEGLSFLTITLPTFARDFERSLEEGSIGSQRFFSFRKGTDGPLPLLLRGVVSQVFDIGSGRLLDNPSIEAILSVRQVCLMFKKVNIACSQRRVDDAIAKYIECDEDVATLPDYAHEASVASWSLDHEVGSVGAYLWHSLGTRFANAWRANRIVPRHGPGATSERISGNRKYALRSWHTRLQVFFPLDQFALPNADWCGTEAEESIHILEPGAETPVRVVTVPKTLKTPRVIAIEPVCMQYTQQALSEFMMDSLERYWPSKGHVNFRDQSINQQLALKSSKDGSYATLDLSEASDRVSVPLVKLVFKACPDLLEAFLDTRSTTAQMPDGSIRTIKKFASMGSALCFPVEACVFFTLAVVGRLRALNLPAIPSNIKKCVEGVYVYGDDIIVPKDEVKTIIRHLEAFGLKVNADKSFWTGKFRESCGMDAYDGERVTPIYLRELPRDGRSKDGIVSLVSFANQLYKNGWWHTARGVRHVIEDRVGPLPHVSETSPGLGWHSYLGSYSAERWDEKTQVFKVKTYALRPIEHDDPLHGHGALLKFFLSRGKTEGKSDFHKSVRRGDVHVNRRW